MHHTLRNIYEWMRHVIICSNCANV